MSEARYGRQARMFLPIGTVAAALSVCCSSSTTHAHSPTTTIALTLVEQLVQDEQAVSKDEIQVTFSFKNQTWDEILDFFSRATGLPIVREVEPPAGTVTYIYPQPYPLPEALETLNILLQTKGVMLRREQDRLYLQKLSDMKRENIPTFVSDLPDDVTDDQIVTVLVPLVNADSGSVAEQLSGLVADYGSVTALPKQNSVLVVETAAQVRRIKKIVDEIDREDVENIVEYIPIRYANAVELAKSLTSLMGERVVQYVVDAKGKKVKVEDEQLPGLQITPDERTNAIIAKGTRARIDKLKETITLLDVPEGGVVARTMRTIQVVRATPSEAAKKLQQFYASLPQESRPVVVSLDDVDKVTIVGDASAVAEGVALLQALDEVGAVGLDPVVTELLPVAHGTGKSAITAIRPMLGPRRERSLLLVPGPDQHSIIASGPERDIDQVKNLLDLIDRPARINKSVEFLTIQSANPTEALERAREIYKATTDESDPLYELKENFDPSVNELTLTGSEEAIARFRNALTQASATIQSPRVVKRVTVTNAKPSVLQPKIESLTKRLLDPRDGSFFEPPRFEAVDELGVLIVDTDPASMGEITQLLSMLDQSGMGQNSQIIELQYARAESVKSQLEDMLASAPIQLNGEVLPAPTISVIEPINALYVLSDPATINFIQRYTKDLDTIESNSLPPMKFIPVRSADAESLARALTESYEMRPIDERATRPVRINADPETNSLVITAHPEIFDEINGIVAQLNDMNRLEDADREIRIFPLRVARAEDLAQTLDEMFPQPPMPHDSRGRPRPDLQLPREVVVRADRQTNSIIVDAPTQRMASFEKLVEQLDRTQIADETEIRTWKLVRSELSAVATTLQRIADSGGFGSANGVGAASVTISTEPKSGTLLVSGPSEIFPKVDSVIQSLEAGKPVPSTALRFFRLTSARAETLVPVLRDVLATRIQEDVPGGVTQLDALLEITSDRKTNMLIVQAPESVMPIAEEIIKQLDSGMSSLEDPIVRVHPLTFADPSMVAQSIQAALPSVISKATGDPIDVKLIPSPGANALIMVGLPADLDEVDVMIKPLDERPAIDAVDAQTFELVHANAAEIAPLVERLLTDQEQNDPRVLVERIRRSRGQVSFEPQTRVESDIRTNSLIVSGPQQSVVLARTLIEQLDRPESTADRTYLTYTPTNGDLIRLADTARRVLAATRPTGARSELELIPDPQTGVIVIVGSSAEARGAEAMLKAWDADSYVPAIDMKIVDVEHGDAQAIAGMVEPMLLDQSRWPQKLRAAVSGGLRVNEPRVSVEQGTNRLLVSAPAELLPIATELIAQLDQPTNQTPGEVRVYSLIQAQAPEVASAIQQAIRAMPTSPDEMAPTVIAEPSSNSIVVTGTPKTQAEIALLIQGFDSSTGSDVPGVRTVMLKYARAEVVAPLVQSLMNNEEDEGYDFWSRRELARERARRGIEEKEAVRVEADSRLNAVIIAGPPSQLAVAQKAVEQLDVNPAGSNASKRSVRVLAVENADAAELAENLRALFADGEDGQQPPIIQVDLSSNALLVRANDEQFAMIERVTKDVEDATVTTARELRTIPIDGSRANANDVARLLKRLLDRDASKNEVEVIPLEELLEKYGQGEQEASPAANDQSKAKQTSMAPSRSTVLVSLFVGYQEETDAQQDGDAEVVIAVDPETNSLVVLGSPRSVARVRALAQQAQDELPIEGTSIRAIPLPEGVSPEQLRVLIDRTLRTVRPAGGKKGDLVQRVGVIADANTRSLVITANDEDFKTVASLVSVYAKQSATEEVSVRSYVLNNVSADRAVTGLMGLLDRDKGNRRGQNQLNVTFGTSESSFDPNNVRVVSDLSTNSVIVLAPEDAFEFVDKFLQMLDQEPTVEYRTIQTFEVKYADASEMATTLSKIFSARIQDVRSRMNRVIKPTFASDKRINALIVTASAQQLSEVESLLQELDKEAAFEREPLQLIELASARPSSAARILEQVVVGDDQALRSRTMLVPDDQSGILLVRADEEVSGEIKRVLAEIDRDSTAEFPVRSIILERADAGAVARAIQTFYDDRARIASGARGNRLKRQVAVVGDAATSTLLIAASDEDYADVEKLIAQLDSIEATNGLEFRAFPLKHAKAQDALEVLQEVMEPIVDQLGWSRNRSDALSGATLARLNAILVTGNGELFKTVEEIIKVIDQPASEGTERIVRVYSLQGVDVRIVRNMIREALGLSESNWWNDNSDSAEAAVEYDRSAQLIIVAGTEEDQATAEEVVQSFESALAMPDQQIEVIALEYAPANEVARTLENFLEDRADAMGQTDPTTSIASSEAANTLLISASKDDMATLQDLIGRIDLPEASGDRIIEILPLGKGEAIEIARLVTQQFPRRGGAPGVIITADVRTNSLVVNAPKLEFAQVKALVDKLDGPPMREETLIRTFVLEKSNADEAMSVLKQTLALDEQGRTTGATVKVEGAEGDAVEVVARIVADPRSNTLVVAATQESFPVIDALVAKLEDAPSVTPIEYRIIPLKHAEARDITLNLDIVFRNRGGRDNAPSIDWTRDNQLVVGATAEQFEMIETILGQLDQPSALPRITDFYPLQYAEADKVQNALSYFYGPFAVDVDDPAKKNVQIAADLATNSLVISADENEWVGIRSLLEKLDSEEYDASLQLKVLPLTYADARSVARAINEAFRGPIERDRENQRRNQGGDRDDRNEPSAPTILVEAEEWVSAAAEEQTNAVIVSASRQNLLKIEQIVQQIDVADFMKMPAPRLIPVEAGSPMMIAESLRELYLTGDARGGMSTRIVPDETSGTIIVRAEESEFAQIKALADALQQEASVHGLAVHVMPLESANADLIVNALEDAFAAQADQANAPLSINADPAGNTIVVACTGAMWDDIQSTIRQMDTMRPAAGQGIFLIDLKHVPADEVRRVIEEIGLDQQPDEGAIGRMVVEPVRVSTLAGRNAILVLAHPADRDVVVAIAKSLDTEPEMAQAEIELVALENTQASEVVAVLESLFDATSQRDSIPIADALQEQVRRLKIMNNQIDAQEHDVDLSKPIRLIGDDGSNTILIASSSGNVAAVKQLAGMLDKLPVTGAATVRLFPLENIAAAQFVRIVTELHEQGKTIGQTPGGRVQGIPAGSVGRALMENVALSIDDRTNTVIAAGTEDSVALVEVLVQRLDTELGLGWVEVKVLPLRFADAESVSQLIESVLVEGSTELPAAIPLQNQAARLRIMNKGRQAESDVFVPMTRLLIRPDGATNSLVVVGTAANLQVIDGLVAMMDVESAFPGALVRIYPLENASASRLTGVLKQLFESQIRIGSLRDEDRVEIIPDERSNALVVSTTSRSFAVLEQLLATLDTRIPPDIREIKMVQLEHASAARIAPLVQRMMDARVERIREVQPETADLEKVLVVSDERTNSIVVAAGNDTFETVRRLVRDLDEAPVSEHGEIAVVPVGSGAVDRLAQAIDRIMERRYAAIPGEVARARRPLVLTDSRSSSLLVAADPEDLASIELLVQQLSEVPLNPAVGLHVVSLDRGDVEQFASRLEALMRDRSNSLGETKTPTDEVSISADPMSRTLIIAANAENYQIVQSLVDSLVRAGAENAGLQDVEIVSLANQDAEDVVDLVDEMYVQDENRRRGETVIRVSADERLNAVVINGPTDDRATIKRLIERLDDTRPSQVVEIKYIPLGAANAVETVSLIENVLSGNTLAGRRGSEQATVIRYLQELEGEDGVVEEGIDIQTEVSTAIRESISLTPDMRTNTVIVRAPRDAMNLLERMIRDLDSTTTGNQDIRVFRLTNADADAMAEILGDLFSLRQEGNLYVLKPRESAEVIDETGVAVPGEGALGTDLTLVPDQRQALSITVDSRTNSLLVSGTPTYLGLVSDVVEQLDAEEANERETFVYPLRNAQASDIASVISEFVSEDQRKLIETLGSEQLPSASRLLEREVTIVGDNKSNSVLVNASPRYRERVMEMIQELDIDPPQVMIQVLLADITLDNGNQFGLTVNDQAGILPLNATFGFAGGILGGGVGGAFAIDALDLKLTLAAMESQRRFQLLSNPSITVANNEEGRIQVGETLRLPDSVATFDTGIQNAAVVPEQVGTILTVRPTINPDGYVRMEISPEISKLSDKTTQISTDFQSPIVIRRTATTTITVRDGETVVIGGLIRADFERSDQKVPLLGDIPLLGSLFRSEKMAASRTELLIVLTPHVISSPSSRTWKSLTDEMVDDLPVPKSLQEQIREGELDGSSGVLNGSFETKGLDENEG